MVHLACMFFLSQYNTFRPKLTLSSGKTLTVEAIAEYIKVPLYRVSAAELESKPKDLETNLSDIFKKANRWGAVSIFAS
jgi:hypothetical protein